MSQYDAITRCANKRQISIRSIPSSLRHRFDSIVSDTNRSGRERLPFDRRPNCRLQFTVAFFYQVRLGKYKRRISIPRPITLSKHLLDRQLLYIIPSLVDVFLFIVRWQDQLFIEIKFLNYIVIHSNVSWEDIYYVWKRYICRTISRDRFVFKENKLYLLNNLYHN